MDAFIFVGINFRGWNRNHTFVGVKIRGHSTFLHNSYRKIAFSWVLEFVDWTLHENHGNWYPMKIKPSTVIFHLPLFCKQTILDIFTSLYFLQFSIFLCYNPYIRNIGKDFIYYGKFTLIKGAFQYPFSR